MTHDNEQVSYDICGNFDEKEWLEEYFQNMGEGNIDSKNINIINQHGKGLGKSRHGKAMYKIPKKLGNVRPLVISPVEQGIAQAREKTRKKKP